MESIKRKEGRQPKMKVWVNELKNLLTDINILFITDKELIQLVNSRLQTTQQITKTTFINWKNGNFHESDELGNVFYDIIAIHNIRVKRELCNCIMNDTKGDWKKYTWLLQRKYPEWNLKKNNYNLNIDDKQELTININTINENK